MRQKGRVAVGLDAGAVAYLLNHLHVVVDTLFQAFGFEVLANLVEVVAPLVHVALYLEQRIGHVLFGGEEVGGRVDDYLVEAFEALSADGVEAFKTFYLVVPE